MIIQLRNYRWLNCYYHTVFLHRCITTRICQTETNANFLRIYAADGWPRIIVCWMHRVVWPWIELHLRITSIPLVQPSMKKVDGYLWLRNATDIVLIQQLTTARPLNVTYTRLFSLLFSLKRNDLLITYKIDAAIN